MRDKVDAVIVVGTIVLSGVWFMYALMILGKIGAGQ